jgi:phytoene dehydrogenase-like protein
MSNGVPATADVVVIGGGHNGLVCAFYLAKAGKSVVLLERRTIVGGACVTEELVPGARFSTCASLLWQLQPKVEDDMELHRHGLRYDPVDNRLSLFPNGERLHFTSDTERNKAEVGRLNANDGRRLDDWNRFWLRAASLVHPFFLRDAPTESELRLHAQRLGAEDVLDVLLSQTTAEVCDRFFEDERVKATLAFGEDDGASAEKSAFVEAWSHTAVFTRPGATGGAFPKGGMGAVTQAMRSALEEAGGVVVTGAEVRAILCEGETAAGVELADGTCVTAGAVVSNADPKRTFSKLLPGAAPAGDDRWSTRVGYQKFHALVRELPDLREYFDGEQPAPESIGFLRIAPSPTGCREALEAAQAGELPEVPVIGGLFTPSIFDDSLAPEGYHTVSAWVLYAPGRLASGSWDAARVEAGRRFINRVDEFIPNFESSLVDWTLFLPSDIEERIFPTDGNIRHLDMVAGQYWDQRPAAGWGHRSPVAGLYLCGAGTHPGGEVTGANGFNAARSVLEDAVSVENQVLAPR